MAPVDTVRLSLDPADLKWFRRHVGTERCFPATLSTDEGSWPVWIGYRGNYSRRFRKPSYDIWFSEERSFHGHLRLHLNAAYRDPSLLRGRLSLETFAALGVTTPEARHVWLTINDRTMGLYVQYEALDAAWFMRHGLKPRSIYYAVGTDGNFGLLDPLTGRPKRYVALGYEKCYPADDDFTDLETLIYGITLPEEDEFGDVIERAMDVESILRWMVGLEFTSHTDGLVQNYALFRAMGGRWQISPWDCDGTWGRMPGGYPLPVDDMPVGTGEDNYLLVRLLATPRWRNRYLEIWEEALAGPLACDRVEQRVKAIHGEIRTHALADWRKRRSDDLFLRQPLEIRRYCAGRTAYVLRRLSELRKAWRI